MFFAAKGSILIEPLLSLAKSCTNEINLHQ